MRTSLTNMPFLNGKIFNLVFAPGAKQRAALYEDLARIHEKDTQEGLLEFLSGEIFNTRIDRNRARAWMLTRMRRRYMGEVGAGSFLSGGLLSGGAGPHGRIDDGSRNANAKVDSNSAGANTGAKTGTYTRCFAGLVPRSDLMQLASIDRTARDEAKALGLRRLAAVVREKHGMVTDVASELAIAVVALPITYLTVLPTAKVVNAMHVGEDGQRADTLAVVTRVLANAVLQYGGVALALLVLFCLSLFWVLPSFTGKLRLQLDRLPFVGMYREFVGADVAMSLAALLQNKVDLVEALQTLHSQGSPWVRWHITRILSAMVQGRSDDYVFAFGRGMFAPALVARIATVSRTTNSFTQVLIEIGTNGIASVRARIRNSAKVASLGILLVCAAFVSFLTLGPLSASMQMGAPANQSLGPKAAS